MPPRFTDIPFGPSKKTFATEEQGFLIQHYTSSLADDLPVPPLPEKEYIMN